MSWFEKWIRFWKDFINKTVENKMLGTWAAGGNWKWESKEIKFGKLPMEYVAYNEWQKGNRWEVTNETLYWCNCREINYFLSFLMPHIEICFWHFIYPIRAPLSTIPYNPRIGFFLLYCMHHIKVCFLPCLILHTLTHWSLVRPYGIMELVSSLVWCQATPWTNGD